MEFYHSPSPKPQSRARVSIPNGMEFYSIDGVSFGEFKKVSIPNGMEFYAIWIGRILIQSVVSIPNRMEFYANNSYDDADKIGFNSQRDGILRCLCSHGDGDKKMFQFPTGWNSTWILRAAVLWKNPVSIPNGMEFYLVISLFIS